MCGGEAVFHHVSKKPVYGTLQKPGARRDHKWGAGLCDPHHTHYHKVSCNVQNFEDEFGVNLDDEAERNYNDYWPDKI